MAERGLKWPPPLAGKKMTRTKTESYLVGWDTKQQGVGLDPFDLTLSRRILKALVEFKLSFIKERYETTIELAN